jgi:GTP-binding protein Era
LRPSFRSARRAARNSMRCSPKRASTCRTTSCCSREDEITDRSEKFLAAEYIREKLFRLIGDELPYGAAVEVERSSSTVRCAASARRSSSTARDTSRSSSARAARVVKRIASEARQDMERMFGGAVFLEVFVKVKSGWADDERMLKSLGYE